MAELTDSLNRLLEGRAAQIGERIGADENQTRQALHAAVPALLAAFSQEAERGGGIRTAIEQDHDGAIIDQLSEYLGGSAQLSSRTTDGAGILDHVLGDRQGDLQQRLSGQSGLSAGNIGNLLVILAPIVMGMLGKKGRTSGGGSGGGAGGFNLDDIGDLLHREKQDAKAKNPDIGDILDSFGQGSGTTSGSRSRSGSGSGDMLDGFLGKKDR